MTKIDVLFDIPMELGESPFWHSGEHALYWIDITSRMVHAYAPNTKDHRFWTLPAEPGCAVRCENGGLVVAMRTGIVHLDTDTGKITPIVEAPYDVARMRFNDGRCDAAGRLWTGTIYEPRDRQGASLFCLDRDQLRDVAHPVTVSNGVAFGVDNRTLYHTDTTAHRITAYDFDLESGKTSNGQVFHEFSKDRSNSYGGRPDGAAVDSENCYWCAMYEGGRILRLSPSGEVLAEITLPLVCPTMIAFGGPDLRTLYITSARHNRPRDELDRYPLAGCVLSIEMDIQGKEDSSYR